MALHTPEAAEGVALSPVCDGEPRVLVVMRHPAMLRFTRQLLERECECWVATEVRSGPSLARALDELTPDLLVIDAADFPSCCLAALDHIPRERVIVIGPELDKAYRAVALANGAGGWLAREEVADKLSGEMHRVLGCRHLGPRPTARCRMAATTRGEPAAPNP
jgi:DNA-binding NarL/FixJ family response regulator